MKKATIRFCIAILFFVCITGCSQDTKPRIIALTSEPIGSTENEVTQFYGGIGKYIRDGHCDAPHILNKRAEDGVVTIEVLWCSLPADRIQGELHVLDDSTINLKVFLGGTHSFEKKPHIFTFRIKNLSGDDYTFLFQNKRLRSIAD